jgi:hypothetical protein
MMDHVSPGRYEVDSIGKAIRRVGDKVEVGMGCVSYDEVGFGRLESDGQFQALAFRNRKALVIQKSGSRFHQAEHAGQYHDPIRERSSP